MISLSAMPALDVPGTPEIVIIVVLGLVVVGIVALVLVLRK